MLAALFYSEVVKYSNQAPGGNPAAWSTQLMSNQETPMSQSKGTVISCELPINARFQDLTGRKYGKLIVVSYAGKVGDAHTWNCRCECGRMSNPHGNTLRSGGAKTCGYCTRKINPPIKPGAKFGKLTVLHQVDCPDIRGVVWECRCDCGQSAKAQTRLLNSGGATGCVDCSGQGDRGFYKKHGISKWKHPQYDTWNNMIQRCTNPKNNSYYNYGARGISVCDRWMVFDNYLSDVGPKPLPELTVDRIDNDGDYEPSNVRWATRKQQQNNRRRSKSVNGSVD